VQAKKHAVERVRFRFVFIESLRAPSGILLLVALTRASVFLKFFEGLAASNCGFLFNFWLHLVTIGNHEVVGLKQMHTVSSRNIAGSTFRIGAPDSFSFPSM